MAITYKDAGVDIDAGDELVRRIKPLTQATRRPEVLSGLGSFSALCSIPSKYREPILVSGTDGVGTKLKTAFATGRHDTVGIDLVAMAVNDVLVTGAEPLFFLDYFATGKLDVDAAADVVRGIAEGCQQAGCALIGGETAELPGLYKGGEYDLAGFCVGVVERSEIITGAKIAAGDAVIGVYSNGLHSNGHSLARRVVLEELNLNLSDAPDALGGSTVADELLRPTLIYAKAVAELGRANVSVHGLAHITGGGLVENPPRMLPSDDLAVNLETSTWRVPAVFSLIASADVDTFEMRRTFNMGLGLLAVVPEGDADRAVEALGPDTAARVGNIIPRRAQPVEFH
jgi:phosphoribosylformylglycinamidine cyclo-ligase